MKVNRGKTEYMCVHERQDNGKVRMQGEEVAKVYAQISGLSCTKHRCQQSRNRVGNPAFWLLSRIFARTSRISGFISKQQKSVKIAIILGARRHLVRKSSAKTSVIASPS